MILLECPQEVSQNKAKDKRYVCNVCRFGACSLHILHGGTFRTRDGYTLCFWMLPTVQPVKACVSLLTNQARGFRRHVVWMFCGDRGYPRSKVLHPRPLRFVGAVHEFDDVIFWRVLTLNFAFHQNLMQNASLSDHGIMLAMVQDDSITLPLTVFLFHISYIHTNANIQMQVHYLHAYIVIDR